MLISKRTISFALHRVSVPQNKCYRVAHIKKLDYEQNIQAIFLNIYDRKAKIQGTFQVYQIGEDRAACCGITTGRSQKSNQS